MSTYSSRERSADPRKPFEEALARRFLERNPESRWEKNRSKAWERFLQIGLPHAKTEVYRYLRLNALYQTPFASISSPMPSLQDLSSHLLPECTGGRLVFVNGEYAPPLSDCPSAIERLPLEEALRKYSTLIQNRWSRLLQEEMDPFAALNAALHPSSTFLYLAPRMRIEEPIQILHWIQSDGPAGMLFPHLQIFAGRESSAAFCTTTVLASSGEILLNQVADFSLEEGAQIRCIRNDASSPSLWQFSSVRASLKRDALFENLLLTEGSRMMRHDYRVDLLQENAEVRLRGLSLAGEKDEAHTHIRIDHRAPHCRSHQHFKTMAFGESRSSFEGKIYVHAAAQKTEAYQLNQNLLVDPRAKVYSKPNLEIFADDVKASHGSTIGQIDAEQQHYMQTKGIPSSLAKQLLLQAFAEGMTSQIPYSSLRDLPRQTILKRMGGSDAAI